MGKIFQTASTTNSFILDSTSFKICENIRFCTCRLFPDFAGWAYSSTRRVFGFKLRIVIDGQGTIVAFRPTNGNRHGIEGVETCFEGVWEQRLATKAIVPTKSIRKIYEKILH
ncbi:MAG: transposase [Puniceicoccales bacterium]|nr:transposase [Puniceicoccales bacterium]